MGVLEYENLVKQCYILSKNINTSYLDILNLTLTEKNLMLNWLEEEAKRKEEEYSKYTSKHRK